MPELPEVQTIISDLNAKVLNTKITKIEIRLPKIIKNEVSFFTKNLKNNSFKKITRTGKLIVAELNAKDKFLLIHLRMTGQVIYQKKDKLIAGGHSDPVLNMNLPNKHTHLILHFEDGSKIFYNDQRQFGVVQIVNEDELIKIQSKFGVEPLNNKFTFKVFESLIKNKKTNIKAFLLNQKYIAGIGNIYADEILFESGVLPTRTINTLTKAEQEKIYKNTIKILKKAVKYRGTTFNDYVDANGNKGNFVKLLKVYGRDGQKCTKCDNLIEKTRVAGRGTRFCAKCQK